LIEEITQYVKFYVRLSFIANIIFKKYFASIYKLMTSIINYHIVAFCNILQFCQNSKMHFYIRVSHSLLRTGKATIGASRLYSRDSARRQKPS